MWLYDILAAFRNVKNHRWLSPKQVRRAEPALKDRGLTGAALYAVTARGSGDVWAGGDPSNVNLLFRWNGMAWSPVTSFPTSSGISSIWAHPTGVWVVSQGGQILRGQ